jgi:SAM-dependent methyltransferase
MVGVFAFEHWRENFDRLRKRYDLELTTVADVACGTGLASRYLEEMGARVYAIDISLRMLREAAAATPPGRAISMMRQDMRYLYPPARVPLLICATDSLNHLLRKEDIGRTFASFHAALLPGGYAVFDMNTSWQLREGGDGEPWEFEAGGQPMCWVSEWSEGEQKATLILTFYGAGEGEGDVEEIHRERAYEPQWLLEELGRAGFDRAEVLDATGLGKVTERTRRLLFVAGR